MWVSGAALQQLREQDVLVVIPQKAKTRPDHLTAWQSKGNRLTVMGRITSRRRPVPIHRALRAREHRPRGTRTRRIRVRSGSRGDPPDDGAESEPPLVLGRAARGRLGVGAA
jgi:hypothetical protein